MDSPGTVVEGLRGYIKSARFRVRTLVYRIASSQCILTNGTIPSRCAINSSGRTVVLISISTMSMAALKGQIQWSSWTT